MKSDKFENLKYLIKYPKGYCEGKKYPVILFLHGAGTRGDNIESLQKNAIFVHTAKFDHFPFVVAAPLCNENSWFDMLERLKRFTEFIIESPFADKNRIYLMGTSMGGYGAWQLAMNCPEYFAAMVPVCGGGMCWSAGRLKNIPVWAFHGGKDTTVFLEESQRMVDAVNKSGGNAKLTIYPENGHNAWTDTYSNYEVYEWLLKHSLHNSEVLKDDYNDSEIYG